jgi:hypothetical protein
MINDQSKFWTLILIQCLIHKQQNRSSKLHQKLNGIHNFENMFLNWFNSKSYYYCYEFNLGIATKVGGKCMTSEIKWEKTQIFVGLKHILTRMKNARE